jgi:hypothetical protein
VLHQGAASQSQISAGIPKKLQRIALLFIEEREPWPEVFAIFADSIEEVGSFAQILEESPGRNKGPEKEAHSFFHDLFILYNEGGAGQGLFADLSFDKNPNLHVLSPDWVAQNAAMAVILTKFRDRTRKILPAGLF